ncbi:MAG: hypothetical protein DI536_19960 [Archangium gephyra]|uniref:Uncharacterized protein n=1 Tax=Archangium gephyra TaxID=48 RepID=A0A2W5T4V8_9BACT|nr:MAG: hypothetical protein DI536_19960 [Archangium gephyra]
MNVMTMSPPVSLKFSARAWWLLILLPVNVLMLAELRSGTHDTRRWLGALAPVLPLLLLVVWAEIANSPRAVRLRTELRLMLPVGVVLLLATGFGMVLPSVFPAASALVMVVSQVLSLVLPSAVILVPLTWEAERGTLPALMTSPRAGQVIGEKFALSALVIVTSFTQVALSPGNERSYALAGHVIALATALPWFFFAKKDVSSLGLTVVVPILLVLPFALFESMLGVVVLGFYGVTMLALVPRAVRRGVFAPGFGESWVLNSVGGPERRLAPLLGAELREQRESVLLGVLALTVAVALSGHRELQVGMLFFLSAAAAALSPAQAFAEARRTGTLELRLSLVPRARVFREKALVSLGVMAVSNIVAPVALLMSLGSMQWSAVPAWAMEMVVIWALALAVSIELSGAAVSLAMSSLIATGVMLATVMVFIGGYIGAAYLASHEGRGSEYLGAVMFIVLVTALVVAQQRFVALRPLRRVLLVGVPFVLFSALSLGGAAALSGG